MIKNITTIVLGGNVILLMILLVSASFTERQQYKFSLSAEEAYAKLNEANYFVSPKEAISILESDDAQYAFVDVRPPKFFANNHIEGAVNIPLASLLEESNQVFFKSDKKKILYCASSVKASEVWLYLTQYGYENLFVLQGGMNYWSDRIESNNIFSEEVIDDEAPGYDLEAINRLKEGKPLEVTSPESPLELPVKRKRKSVQGGCS